MKSRNEQIFLGKEIVIHYLYGEDGTFVGKTGYVTSVDNDGNLFGTWGDIMVIPGQDSIAIIG